VKDVIRGKNEELLRQKKNKRHETDHPDDEWLAVVAVAVAVAPPLTAEAWWNCCRNGTAHTARCTADHGSWRPWCRR